MGRGKGSTSARFARCMAAFAALLVAAPASAFDARVAWGPVANVAGYRLYVRQNGQSYGPAIDVGLVQPVSGVVTYVAPNLPNGITNFFSVSSYDGLGRESRLSNELALLFGTPIATVTPTRTPTLQPATPTLQPAAGSPTAAAGVPTGRRTRTPTLGPSTTATEVFTPTATPLGRRRVRFKKARVAQGTTVSVPVRISAGSAVRFVTLEATYDPGIVVAGPVDVSAEAGGGSVSANRSTPGTLSISAALQQPMSARGVLLDVPFTAVGPCKSRTVIEITSCVLDGGAVECRTNNGRIRVRCR